MYPHAARRAGLDGVPDPSTVRDVRSAVIAVFERLDALDDVSRAAFASPIADEVRHATMPSRFERMRAIGDVDRTATGEAPTWIGSRGSWSSSSRQSSLRTWRDHLGASAEQVGRRHRLDPPRRDRRGDPRGGEVSAAAVRRLRDVRMADVAEVGGKAASLGELLAAGVGVPDGVVVTAEAGAMTADERRSAARRRDMGPRHGAVCGAVERHLRGRRRALLRRHVRVGAGRVGRRPGGGSRAVPGERPRGARGRATALPATAAWP